MPKKKKRSDLEEDLDGKLDYPTDESVDDEEGADLLKDDSMDEEESADGEGF